MRKALVRESIASTWLDFRRELRQVLCSLLHLALVFETITSSFSSFLLFLSPFSPLPFALLLLEYLSVKNCRRHRPTRSTLRSRRHLMVFYRCIDEHVWSSAQNNSTKIQYLRRASCSSLARSVFELITMEYYWIILAYHGAFPLWPICVHSFYLVRCCTEPHVCQQTLCDTNLDRFIQLGIVSLTDTLFPYRYMTSVHLVQTLLPKYTPSTILTTGLFNTSRRDT